MLPPDVERSVAIYLRALDRHLPGRAVGVHVVGSVALGTYLPGRSDIDLVVIVDDGPISFGAVRRLQWDAGLRGAVRQAVRGRQVTTGSCNAAIVRASDLTKPVTTIVPVGAHIGTSVYRAFAGSDVSPVGWKTLREKGIAVRGPAASTLGLDPEPDRLVAWNLGNLHDYWVPWAAAARRTGRPFRLRPRWSTTWVMLGPTRLHATIATGEILAKEATGAYALATFDRSWHDLVEDALAYRRRGRAPKPISTAERVERCTAFVDVVTADAERIAI